MRARLFVALVAGATLAAGLRYEKAAILPADSRPSLSNGLKSAVIEPGGRAADKDLAWNHPDQYAWVLFAYLTRQAQPGVAGVVDPLKATFHEDQMDDKTEVWESWALASSSSSDFSNKSEVFHADGSRPTDWCNLGRNPEPAKSLSRGLTMFDKPVGTQSTGSARPALDVSNEDNTEVRINRQSFQTIVDFHLYSKEGVESALLAARRGKRDSFVTFPAEAKEVKAAWRHLTDCDKHPTTCPDKSRYHWRTIQKLGGPQVWGLAALHIMTRDLDNWFWADFTHKDCNAKRGACAPYAVGAAASYISISDTTSEDSEPKRERHGTRWDNYVLRGTQTSFVKDGHDVALSNPVLEPNSKPTSCMTCHSYAAAGWSQAVADATDRSDAFLPNPGTLIKIGVPPVTPKYLPAGVTRSNNNGQAFLQSSFEWSIIQRAKHEKRQSPVAALNPTSTTIVKESFANHF